MFWQEVCENSSLKDLPFKIELNTQGQLLMTPVKVNHSLIQGKIIGERFLATYMELVKKEEKK